jgi:hypothetical protein
MILYLYQLAKAHMLMSKPFGFAVCDLERDLIFEHAIAMNKE